MIDPHKDIAAVILAGGRGTRMGGADKGLQEFNHAPLALHALLRIQPQVAEVCINANRNIGVYEGFGVPVVFDHYPDFPGPLAGFHSGLVHTTLPYLLTLPCDVPSFPTDLAIRLSQPFSEDPTLELAVASAAGKAQPVFSLMSTQVITSLEKFLKTGQGKIDKWFEQLKFTTIEFPEAEPFHNLNTLNELREFERNGQ